MGIEQLLWHRNVLRSRQRILADLDDELCAIRARHHQELEEFYVRRNRRLQEETQNQNKLAQQG